MKNISITALLMTLAISLNAQRAIEKIIDHKGQEVTVDLAFARHIEIKNWDRQSVGLIGNLKTEDGKFLDLYTLEVSEGESTIEIKSDATPVFEAFQREYEKDHPREKKDHKEEGIYYTESRGPEHEFNYVIYVPKGTNVKISSITGELSSEKFEGELKADLISGDITIGDYKGILDLNTITGDIDLRMTDASLEAETIQGNIYADEKLILTSADRLVGHKVSGETPNPQNTLKLNTINGNMYLRY